MSKDAFNLLAIRGTSAHDESPGAVVEWYAAVRVDQAIRIPVVYIGIQNILGNVSVSVTLSDDVEVTSLIAGNHHAKYVIKAQPTQENVQHA